MKRTLLPYEGFLLDAYKHGSLLVRGLHKLSGIMGLMLKGAWRGCAYLSLSLSLVSLFLFSSLSLSLTHTHPTPNPKP